MANLIERHAEKIVGVLSCFDRLVLQGTLPSVAYPQAVATELDRRDIRFFDYAKQFALPFREAIRARTERLAAEEGVEIEYIQRMKAFRKEDRIQQILAARGNHPGLVHSFSAMEPCPTYEPWHDKKTGCTFIRRERGKCLHYYFYFIDLDARALLSGCPDVVPVPRSVLSERPQLAGFEAPQRQHLVRPTGQRIRRDRRLAESPAALRPADGEATAYAARCRRRAVPS